MLSPSHISSSPVPLSSPYPHGHSLLAHLEGTKEEGERGEEGEGERVDIEFDFNEARLVHALCPSFRHHPASAQECLTQRPLSARYIAKCLLFQGWSALWCRGEVEVSDFSGFVSVSVFFFYVMPSDVAFEFSLHVMLDYFLTYLPFLFSCFRTTATVNDMATAKRFIGIINAVWRVKVWRLFICSPQEQGKMRDTWNRWQNAIVKEWPRFSSFFITVLFWFSSLWLLCVVIIISEIVQCSPEEMMWHLLKLFWIIWYVLRWRRWGDYVRVIYNRNF